MDKHIDKSKFEYVKVDQKIFDKKFEGKPRSFLSDAMLRFGKNKVNVVATTIVAMVIFLSIFVPVLTTKDYSSANIANTKFLPPRVPLLEKLGIFDGTIEVNNYAADLENYMLIDETLGDVDGNRLYFPKSDQFNPFSKEFIDIDTLTNSIIIGGTKTAAYVGGTNDIILTNKTNHIIGYLESKLYANTTLTIDVNEISEGSYLEIMVRPDNILDLLPEGVSITDLESMDYYTLLGSIDSAGVHDIEVTTPAFGALILVYRGDDIGKRISINSIAADFLSSQDYYFNGFALSGWNSLSMETFGGSWIRSNAEYTVTSFTYYKYNDIFANRESTLSNEDYDLMLLDNPGMEASIVLNDPTDPSKGWTFGEDYPLVGVISESTRATGPDGEQYWSYRVLNNGLVTAGFEELPYFIFGTDSKGRDLFAAIWLSLRTSLLLGLIVSVINIVIGVIWGSISGYFGGWIDFGMERFVEVLGSFPGLTVLAILYLEFGGGFMLLLIYLTYAGWIGVARLTRVQFYRYRGREYVLASRTLGAGHGRLIFKHILPNGIGYIITSVVLSVPAMIITEASLSYLGYGLGEGAVLDFGIFKLSGLSLGIILYNGQNNMTAPGRFYLVMIPAIIIIIIMIAFNLFGNALRDAMNPSLRGQE